MQKKAQCNIFSLIIILIIGNFPLSASPLKPVVAIMDTTGSGISISLCNTVNSLIIQKISSSERFETVDKSRIQKILKEIAFQQKGVTDSESSKKAGKLLSADKLIFSSITRASNISMVQDEEDFLVSISIVDVETGKVDYSKSEKSKGASELTNAAELTLTNVLLNSPFRLKVVSATEKGFSLVGDPEIYSFLKETQYKAYIVAKYKETSLISLDKKQYQGIIKIESINDSEIEAMNLNKKQKSNIGDVLELQLMQK